VLDRAESLCALAAAGALVIFVTMLTRLNRWGCLRVSSSVINTALAIGLLMSPISGAWLGWRHVNAVISGPARNVQCPNDDRPSR
jgi:hypothetical protein